LVGGSNPSRGTNRFKRLDSSFQLFVEEFVRNLSDRIMTSPSLSANHLEWEKLVGRAILRFGDIELVSIKCFALFPTEKIADSAAAAKLDFSPRADLLVKQLEDREDRDDSLDAILMGIRRAKELARKRSVIAHNPVMLDLYVNEDETESFARHLITSARFGNQTLDLEELKEFAEEVDGLAAQLWLAFVKAAGTASHLWQETRADR
jgi:hypothetical protein